MCKCNVGSTEGVHAGFEFSTKIQMFSKAVIVRAPSETATNIKPTDNMRRVSCWRGLPQRSCAASMTIVTWTAVVMAA